MNVTNIGESEQQLDEALDAAFRSAINDRVKQIGKRPENILEALVVDGNRLLVLLDDDTYLSARIDLVSAEEADMLMTGMTMQ